MNSAIDSLEALNQLTVKLIDEEKYYEALSEVAFFTGRIITDSASVGRVLSSLDLDNLCEFASKKFPNKFNEKIGINSRFKTIFLVTQIPEVGGHLELIKDLINFNFCNGPYLIVITNYLTPQSSIESLDKLKNSLNSDFEILSLEISSNQTLLESLSILEKYYAENLVIASYNHDSISIFIANLLEIKNKIFLHHADTHLCLGAATKNFIHYDFHNIGYFYCRNQAGLIDNKYLPLSVNIISKILPKRKFLNGTIKTCSAGRYEKFLSDTYPFNYFELVPEILRTTEGIHIHIGPLPQHIIENLLENIKNQGVGQFIHIPLVASLYEALLENDVDLFISSFPIAGGKTSIEVMASGTPMLMHENYRGRIFGGADIVYEQAYSWRETFQMMSILKNLRIKELEDHSKKAFDFYKYFYSKNYLLEAGCNELIEADFDRIPPLKRWYKDECKTYLEDSALAKAIQTDLKTQISILEQRITHEDDLGSFSMISKRLYRGLLSKVLKF